MGAEARRLKVVVLGTEYATTVGGSDQAVAYRFRALEGSEGSRRVRCNHEWAEVASDRETTVSVLGGVKERVYIDGWNVVFGFGLVLKVPTIKGYESGMVEGLAGDAYRL